MQVNMERYLFRQPIRPQSITPYSRNIPNSPYKFVGRNIGTPKGRVNTADGTFIRRVINNRLENSFVFANKENHVSPKHSYSVGVEELPFDNNVFRADGCRYDAVTTDTFFQKVEHCENRPFEGRASRPGCPVQIGNLSIIELDNKRQVDGGRQQYAKSREGPERKPVLSQSQTSNAKPASEGFLFRRRENQPKLLTGTVEKVAYWFKLKYRVQLLLEVIAILVDVNDEKFPTGRVLTLKDEKTGPSVNAVYYEIDRKLPELTIGEVVRCVGRPTSANCLHVFRVERSSEEERNQSQRLFFISNLAAEEMMTALSKK